MHLTQSSLIKKKVLKGYFTVDILHFEFPCANEDQDSQMGTQEQTGTFTMHVGPHQKCGPKQDNTHQLNVCHFVIWLLDPLV